MPAGGAASITSELAVSADGASTPTEALVDDARSYPVRRWSFSLAQHEPKIADQKSLTTALEAVLAESNAEVTINGGFFDPDGKPVGLAMSDGVFLSKLKTSLGGGVFTFDGEVARIHAAESFVVPDHLRFAVQCRPRLVVDGRANVKSDDGHRAERTALCVKDQGHSVDVVVVRSDIANEDRGPSLFALARHLEATGCEGALNLDGGPSTGVAWREDGAVRLEPPRKPVRHVVAFVPRTHD